MWESLERHLAGQDEGDTPDPWSALDLDVPDLTEAQRALLEHGLPDLPPIPRLKGPSPDDEAPPGS